MRSRFEQFAANYSPELKPERRAIHYIWDCLSNKWTLEFLIQDYEVAHRRLTAEKTPLVLITSLATLVQAYAQVFRGWDGHYQGEPE